MPTHQKTYKSIYWDPIKNSGKIYIQTGFTTSDKCVDIFKIGCFTLKLIISFFKEDIRNYQLNY